MAFWSSLGKGLLKAGKAAAPALNFVPGGQFINAGIGALDTKVNQGGSWGDALKSGLMSGITGGLAKGLSPKNTDFLRGDVGKVAGQVGGGGGWKDSLSRIFGGGGGQAPGQRMPGGMGGGIGGGIGQQGGWQEMLGGILNRQGGGGGFGTPPYIEERGGFNPGRQPLYQGTGGATDRGGQGLSRFHRQMSRQLGPVMGNPNQNNPNLADSIGAGRMEAIRNQPWRQGYDINTLNDDESVTTNRMPSFYPSGGRRRQAVQ